MRLIYVLNRKFNAYFTYVKRTLQFYLYKLCKIPYVYIDNRTQQLNAIIVWFIYLALYLKY